ncbi:MAG TPA: hypothetical protein VD978_32365 [Azospirillum sp.]|nr:hypothetical protein [Azospirillum sp.]
MPIRPGRKLVGGYLDAALAERFDAWARQTDGSASAALRRLISEAVEGTAPAAPRGAGTGCQVGVRFKETERATLSEAARARGTSPTNWVRSLALVHLMRRPEWTPAEIEALRDVFRELRTIGQTVGRMARALDSAAAAGVCPSGQGEAAHRAADRIRIEMRRVVAVLTGNFDYWGLPDAERPTAAPGAVERAAAQTRAAEARRRNRPRRRVAGIKGDG